MEYIIPSKELLEKRSVELEDEKKYYSLSKLIYKKDYNDKLLIPIGINDEDKYYIDLKDKSSILIVGETGSGKSVFINSIILSLLLKNTPDELKFVFIDPRTIELDDYNGIPHMLYNLLTNKEECFFALKSIEDRIEKRKSEFRINGSKDINEFNLKSENKMPHIVIVIDELSEIFDNSDFEKVLLDIIKNGKEYGIHIIMTTNAYIKSTVSNSVLNSFNYIITFDLANKEQADTIKVNKADLLTIYGEAIVKCQDNREIMIQTPYSSNKDIENVVSFIKAQI